MPKPKNAADQSVTQDQTNTNQQDAAVKIQFVKMARNPEQYPAPHEAQVHPDEVDNYRPGGWEIV